MSNIAKKTFGVDEITTDVGDTTEVDGITEVEVVVTTVEVGGIGSGRKSSLQVH